MTERSLLYYDLTRAFARAMGQDPMEPGCDFYVTSKSSGQQYAMVRVDGYAVHQGEECLGARFRGQLSCWHSKEFSVRGEDMTSLVTTQGQALAEVREFSDQDIETLKTTICKGASDSEMHLFIATARHTGLDPFLRQIHCVMRSVKEDNQWVKRMTIQIGIDGYRLIADRTGRYQGSSEPQWTYDGATWEDFPREDIIPLAARVAVWRKGVERPLIGFARWSANVQKTSTGEPNAVWKQRGPEQLAKCAEVQGLRKAFPAEMAALPEHSGYVELDEEPDLDLPALETRGAATESRASDGRVASPPPAQADMKVAEQVAWEQTDAYKQAEAEVARVGELQQKAIDEARAEYLANHMVPEPQPEVAPEEADPPAPSPDEQRARVKAMLEDCKLTWSAKDYLELGQELSIFMPGGDGRFVLSQLEGERLVACIEYLHMKRGELELSTT